MKITKTQLRKMVQEAVRKHLKTNGGKKLSLKENMLMFGMTQPSVMQNPFAHRDSANVSNNGGANSRLNEMLLRNKLQEAQEYVELAKEQLVDATSLATVEEGQSNKNSTKKIVKSLSEQVEQIRKTINKLLGRK